MSSMRLADGSAPNRSVSSARIADSDSTALPVTVILVMRLTGNQLPAQRHALIGRRREDAHVFEAAEADQVIDRAADVAHAERLADARFDELEQRRASTTGTPATSTRTSVMVLPRNCWTSAAPLHGDTAHAPGRGQQRRPRRSDRPHQNASLFRTSSA